MLVAPAIPLDATMSVSAVLARLARHGYWLTPIHPVVHAFIEESAKRFKLPFEEAEQALRRPFSLVGTAIRRQWYANILWYARTVFHVLHCCHAASPDDTLLQAMNLQESDSKPPIDLPADGKVPNKEGVVVNGEIPVAVSLDDWGAPPPKKRRGGKVDVTIPAVAATTSGRVRAAKHLGVLADLPRGNGGDDAHATLGSTAKSPPKEVCGWPRLDAPEYVPARKPFDVTVGLAATQQAGVTGGQVIIHPLADMATIDVTVELIADGLEAPDGWSRTLRVVVKDPTAAEVKFRVIGRDPKGPEPAHLTTLEVRYVYGSTVCGTASRPLVIGQADAATLDLPRDFGTPWLAQTTTASSVTLQNDPQAADLTIELFKPDGNPTKGSYTCRLSSPHPLSTGLGPFTIELGDDAQSFAKFIVKQVRDYAKTPTVANALESVGRLVADKLGPEVIAALRDVAKRVAPAVPAVLLVSAEPYVPWELTFIDPPLDTKHPPFLGAQVLLGRWLRDRRNSTPSPTTVGTNSAANIAMIERPPIQPLARINVKHMAVMAGIYMAASGLHSLPEAENEATTLTQTYDAVPLAASLQAIKQLLDARLEHKFKAIGGVDAAHFAGHGEYDPSNPDASVLFLSDGMPLSSFLFRSAKYGGEQQPLLFLNACMVGIGDELLGDMGGFPGNCLKGGFGGVLGALWEVDDSVARDIALEFWKRALAPTGSGDSAESVGAILRDLRSRYVPDPATVPVATYLAYVYYGHPRLTLRLVP